MNRSEFDALFATVLASPKDVTIKQVARDWLLEYGEGEEDENLAVALGWCASRHKHPNRARENATDSGLDKGCVPSGSYFPVVRWYVYWSPGKLSAFCVDPLIHKELNGTFQSYSGRKFYADERHAFLDLGKTLRRIRVAVSEC